jgi:hypothetical protein
MPRVTIYLKEELYSRVVAAGLSGTVRRNGRISAICQHALADEVAKHSSEIAAFETGWPAALATASDQDDEE